MMRISNGKSVIYVVRVNDYLPKVCEYTLPTIESYAKKVKAEVHYITERKFPDWPASYEKLQVYELGIENEWNYVIDADMLLHPDLPKVTLRVRPCDFGIYYAYSIDKVYYRIDNYFERYKLLNHKHVDGIVTNFILFNFMIHDVYQPLEGVFSDWKGSCIRDHILDEYCITRNIAKLNIPYTGMLLGHENLLLHHLQGEFDTFNQRKKSEDEMVEEAKQVLKDWNV